MHSPWTLLLPWSNIPKSIQTSIPKDFPHLKLVKPYNWDWRSFLSRHAFESGFLRGTWTLDWFLVTEVLGGTRDIFSMVLVFKDMLSGYSWYILYHSLYQTLALMTLTGDAWTKWSFSHCNRDWESDPAFLSLKVGISLCFVNWAFLSMRKGVRFCGAKGN